MKKIIRFFTYFVNIISCPKKVAEAVNVASSPDELDKLICGGKQ